MRWTGSEGIRGAHPRGVAVGCVRGADRVRFTVLELRAQDMDPVSGSAQVWPVTSAHAFCPVALKAELWMEDR